MLFLTMYEGTNEKVIVFCLTISSMCVAFMDVIVDSLMVIQSRKYPEGGSEKLQAFSWIMLAFGGIFGSLAAAIITQFYKPQYCFLFSSLTALVLGYFSYKLKTGIELP